MLNHIEEKPFQCHLCEKKFSQRRSLVDHIRSHTGEKPFLCHVSGERFSRQRTLTNHLQRHTGKKAFQCDIESELVSRRPGSISVQSSFLVRDTTPNGGVDRWVSMAVHVMGATIPNIPSVRRFRMVREDTGASSEGDTCS
ncbi:hypothetical protein TNCV_4755251 [Trichonephila clavipes]|nr:hypothetical protein TNCV_4755251 [Trichonephila clavipes]